MTIHLEDKESQEIDLSLKRRNTWATFTKRLLLLSISLISLSCITTSHLGPNLSESLESFFTKPIDTTGICPIGETIRPASFLKDNSTVEYIVKNQAFKDLSIKKLQGAVKISTVVEDATTSPLENPDAWKSFTRFHWFLEAQFPHVYSTLEVEKVNVYGLVFTWKGSDEKLKPLLLTGHQDTVPVDESTRNRWKYDPFSGHFDGENIWGRGSSDCKTLVIGTLQAVENLITEGYEPKRTIVLAFGFDEEVGGTLGAAAISQVLEEKYGSNSFYAIVDEGGNAITTIGETVFALPSVGEKGSLNLEINLTTPGGHSSVPPDHTNIGLVSKVINEIESTPFSAILGSENPTLGFLQCVAKYSDEFDSSLKSNVFKAGYDRVANSKVLEYLKDIKAYKYLVRTTQAVDIIKGGVKSNALPEFTSVISNHRISIESSLDFTINKIVGNVKAIAKEYDLGVYYEDEEVLPKTENGYFNVTAPSKLAPAPISPTSGSNWDVFAGSIKHIIEDYIYPDLESPAVVSGNLMTGNTDTSHYWNLTNHIYRYRLSTLNGILDGGTHSVNEHTTIDNHLYLIAFIYEYIKNTNEVGDE